MDELPESLKDEIGAYDSLREFVGDKHHVRRHLGEEAHDRLPRRTAVVVPPSTRSIPHNYSLSPNERGR